MDYTIATLGSHSALQILKGAKDEGFKTLAICLRGKERPYRDWPVADEFRLINTYQEFLKLDKVLAQARTIMIPHASLIAYLGWQKVEALKTKYFGNKKILRWEADRKKSRQWLEKAELKLPRVFKQSEEIDRPVIVKFFGAAGGKGYFLASSAQDFQQKIRPYKHKQYLIQEYIIGIPVYCHYFYSNLSNKLEIMSFDKRYESNVDAVGRVSAKDQLNLSRLESSYLVCGNFPIVVRESLLAQYLAMGEAVVKAGKKLVANGLFGPFCLETVIDSKGKIYAFEISARIVAGTNLFIDGSPYTKLTYTEPMSTGRRIAREIRIALETNQLNKILC